LAVYFNYVTICFSLYDFVSLNCLCISDDFCLILSVYVDSSTDLQIAR
jgi:hypothetical protein